MRAIEPEIDGLPFQNELEICTPLERQWAAMFSLMGWVYDPYPPPFEKWQPSFHLFLSRPVFVAVVPPHEYKTPAQTFIDGLKDCPYEVLIVTTDCPIPSPNGRDLRYGIGSIRMRDNRGVWTWGDALLTREGLSVILRQHENHLRALNPVVINENKIFQYLRTKWEEAEAIATGTKLHLNPIDFESEKEFQQTIIGILSESFHVYTKVRGYHPAAKTVKRVDLIIEPRDLTPWKDNSVFFGIELKNPAALLHINDKMKWGGQSLDYAQMEWSYSKDDGKTWVKAGDTGFIQIFTCPGFLDLLPGAALTGERAYISRYMAQNGVGELKPLSRCGWALVRNDDHVIWSVKNGVEDGRKDFVGRRFGSR